MFGVCLGVLLNSSKAWATVTDQAGMARLRGGTSRPAAAQPLMAAMHAGFLSVELCKLHLGWVPVECGYILGVRASGCEEAHVLEHFKIHPLCLLLRRATLGSCVTSWGGT